MSFEVVSSGQLRQYIEKVERLEEEKRELLESIREIFGEAKANGFDVKTMKQVLKLRKMKQEDLMEQEELLDLYLHALGMVPSGRAGSKMEQAA
ncbi:MAG: DUF2312 domain-containing protein [Alphaproteobacteria bacterium]|nr:DUF2312 domain-containing protein [Alphaproteobacteria bacterium]